MQGQKLIPVGLDPKAYRFFPTKEEQKNKWEKKGTRFYFYGQCEHDDYQKRKLKEFHEYCAQKKINYDNNYFNQQKLLLFLSGNKYKPKHTLKAMAEHLKFKKQYLPIPFERVQKMIRSGYFYPCGRDKHFRPVFVYNCQLIDFKDFQTSLRATLFVHQMALKTFFIPGQVECWNIIYDLGGMGLSQIPTTVLKGVLQKISLNYGGRLFRLWILNAPSSITIPFKIVSAFLDDVTVDKIKISKQNTDKSIFEICDPSQIQQKFGGKQTNRTQFWPFTVPQGVYDEKRLVSQQKYKQMILKNQLMRNVIDPKFAQIAKGHVIQQPKNQEIAQLSAGMQNLDVDDEQGSDQQKKEKK